MKIYTETSLRHFEFWSGAIDTANHLTSEQLDEIETQLEDLNPDGMSETEINDLFWFDEDYIAEMLGFDSWDELLESEEA
jgi:hypothetical protein